MYRTTFVAMLLAATLSAQTDGPRFGLEIRGLFQLMPNALGSVSNIPVQFRTIPGHTGDPDSGIPQVVPSDTISPGLFTGLSVGVAPQVHLGKFTLRAGPVLGVYSFPRPRKDSTGNTREINQFGTQERGVGTRLFYYAVVPRANPFSGVYAEVEHTMGSGAGLIGGYSWTPYDYTVKSGWDRYDALESYASNTLASANTNRFYGGVRVGPRRSALLLLAGAARQRITPAAAAGAVNINAPTLVPFVSIGFTTQFGKR